MLPPQMFFPSRFIRQSYDKPSFEPWSTLKKTPQKLSSGTVTEREVAPSPPSRALTENQRDGRKSNNVSPVLRVIGQGLDGAVYLIVGSCKAG